MRFNVEMVDGTRHENVQAIVADQVKYSTTARKHKWPSASEDPLTFGYFVAFAAMYRLGLFTEGWEAFQNATADVELIEDPDPDPLTAGAE